MNDGGNDGELDVQGRPKPRPRPAALRADLLARLKRAEGQVRGLQRMVEENVYCIDILQQVSAVRRALEKLALILVRDHLETCVCEALIEKNSTDKVQELIHTLDRFLS